MSNSIFVKLAKSAAEHFVRTQEFLPLPPALPSEVLGQRSCYISVFENPGRRLRAVYGEPLPRQPTLAQEIIVNTVRAITASPVRQVRRADLSYLVYTVALLGPLQRISDVTHLDPQQYGLQVRSDRGVVGVILPQRVGVDTAQDQIATVLREAGIDSRAESYTMYRFPVIYYDL